jgi:hypothetical protein
VESLVEDSPLNLIIRGTSFSFISVSMNTSISNNREKDQVKTLLTLHKQAKFWVSYG